MGQMVSEKYHIIEKFKNTSPKYFFLQMAACKFGKTRPVNWYTVAVSLCYFFKVTFMLPDRIVKI